MNFYDNVKKLVIKVGSSSITHENGRINLAAISSLCWEMSNLKNHGIQPILVSSGAIAAGVGALNLKERPKTSAEKQAASAVGQVVLMNTYNMSLREHNYTAAQYLLTNHIETDIKMRENAINSFNELMGLDAIPIVNENDAISTFEIEYGDNDTLSAVVARLIDADLLIILSDVDGLFTADPNIDKDAELIEEVEEIDPSLLDIASGSVSNRGTGGMSTKLNAALLCMEKGIDVVMAQGRDMRIIRDIMANDYRGTYFKGVKDDK